MSRELARAVSTAGSADDDDASSGEEFPGHPNMWCPLLEAAYHHRIGALLALNVCHSSKAARSQSCHFGVFVSPVARSSTEEFFTLCDAHLEKRRACSAGMSSSLTQKQVSARWQLHSFAAPRCRRATAHTAGGASCCSLGPTLQESCGSHCRRDCCREVTTCL